MCHRYRTRKIAVIVQHVRTNTQSVGYIKLKKHSILSYQKSKYVFTYLATVDDQSQKHISYDIKRLKSELELLQVNIHVHRPILGLYMYSLKVQQCSRHNYYNE
jgi:hypothetical protein